LDKSSRFDAEFFGKEYLTINSIIEKKPNERLANLTSRIKVGYVGSMINEYVEDGILLLQTNNIAEFNINLTNKIYINEAFNQKLLKSQVNFGDILIARSGSFGKASIYQKKEPANSSDIIIVQGDDDKINKFYLTAFLNSKLGKLQLFRFASGGLQGHVNLTILENLKVATPSFDFQSSIEKLIKKAHLNIEQSESLYFNTEQILLQSVGVSNWKPSKINISVKSFSKSFLLNGRLDAEFYQPKYDELIKLISKTKHQPLDSIVTFKKSIEPGSDSYQKQGIPFIRIADVSKFGIFPPDNHLEKEDFDLEMLKPKKDTILLSKDGSVGIAYKVEKDLDVITSGALLHLSMKDKGILPDYLTLVLNSKLTQMQAERDAGGSIIQHWRPDQIKQVLIPVLPMEMQKELTKKIQQSFKLRQESARLIEIAKKAVEIAIEENETLALKFIQESK
jgi:type I restriction enzyme M protein